MERSQPRLVQALRLPREVACAAACGPWLAAGAGDALRLWRWRRGGWQEAGAERGAHRYGVTAVRWSRGGAALASGGVDGCVRVWAGRALEGRARLAAPGAPAVRALCWAGAGAGGGRLLAGLDDGALCVWDARRGALQAVLRAHEGALHAVEAPAAAALLLTACTDGVLKVFDLAEVCRTGRAGLPPPAPLCWEDGAHDLGALCAAACPRGRAAATGGRDARVRLWAAARGGLAAAGTLHGHAAAVTALSWAGALLASASLDRSARLWAPAALVCLHVLQAHDRYLTCVLLDRDLRYMITGSNDKSVRTWSLGALELDDELEIPCVALEHFGIGDLEGIENVECDDFLDHEIAASSAGQDEGGDGSGGGSGGGAARRVWCSRELHSAAINCIATHGALLATACSDGVVRVLRWSEGLQQLLPEHSMGAGHYPALSVHFGAGGALLLAAGLDGCACLHDVQSGVQLRSLSIPYREGSGDAGEAGGGGVREARISPHRPPLLMLATDDGLVALWTLADDDPNPLHVYESHADAVTCCAWAPDGRLAASGAAGGELRLLAPPPAAGTLLARARAHDLGVQSSDFASASTALGLDEREYLLATTGFDAMLKLWLVTYKEDEGGPAAASAVEVQSVSAHGGGAAGVRWGGGARLATSGADRWARVWAAGRRGARLALLAAVPAPGAGGALAAALLQPALLAVGALDGELALWQLAPPAADDEADGREEDDVEGADPRFWGEAGVLRWLREYVTRAPGGGAAREAEAALAGRALAAGLTGAGLLDEPVDALLDTFGCGTEERATEDDDESGAFVWSEEVRRAARERLRDELLWLRAELPEAVERAAPHALRCPLSHAAMREPARAADGYTYERAALLEWLLVDEGGVSPVTGRRMHNGRVVPNHGARAALRRLAAAAGTPGTQGTAGTAPGTPGTAPGTPGTAPASPGPT